MKKSIGNMQPEIASVFITEELTRRRKSRGDVFREVLPFRHLTRQMVDDPARVLPLLVDTALELCAAASGGISLYEPEPPPGVFRWHHLRGDLERFTGATTPRYYSPCGITLDRRAPILVQRPERVYTWLQDAQVSLPECLLVPLYLGADEPLGTLWIVSDVEGQFDSRHADALADLAGFAGLALRMAADQKKLKDALDTQELLTREMAHRLKNLLAVVQALMNVAAHHSVTASDLTAKMAPILQALSVAQSVTTSRIIEAGTSTDLGELLQVVLAPYMHSSVTVDGPKLELGPQATNVLALVIHELATNSTKYGALSSAEGALRVEWSCDSTELKIRWSEMNGPPIAQVPSAAGFGTMLAARSVAALGGTISPDWLPSGLLVRLSIPARGLRD